MLSSEAISLIAVYPANAEGHLVAYLLISSLILVEHTSGTWATAGPTSRYAS